jgi:hypothetical protein
LPRHLSPLNFRWPANCFQGRLRHVEVPSWTSSRARTRGTDARDSAKERALAMSMASGSTIVNQPRGCRTQRLPSPDAQRVQRSPDRPIGSSHEAVATYGFRSARNFCSRLHFVQTNTSLCFPKVRSAGLLSLSRNSPPHTQRNEGGGSTRGRMWFPSHFGKLLNVDEIHAFPKEAKIVLR